MNSSVSLLQSKRTAAKLWLKLRMPLVAVVVLGTALGGGGFVWNRVQASAEEARAAAAKAELETLITMFRNPYPERLQRMDEVTREVDAAGALRSGDETRFASAAAAIAAKFPQASAVRLVPPSLREPDYDATPPVSFATLDLMRTSRASGDNPVVEVHLYGRNQQHVAMVRRVVDEAGALAGFVLASFPIAEMVKALQAAPLPTGYAELTQRLQKGRRLSIGSAGNAALKSDLIAHAEPLASTSFRLLFWVPRTATSQFTALGNLVPIVAAGTLLVLAGAGGALVAVRRRRSRPVTLAEGVAAVVVDDQGPEGAFAEAARRRHEVPPAPLGAEGITLEEVDGEAEQMPGAGVPPEPLPLAQLEEVFVAGDEDLETAAIAAAASDQAPGLDTIFRAYDIRGIVGETLTADSVRQIGRAIGAEAYERGQQTLVVARDGRLSSEELAGALIEGLMAAGRDVVDVGRVPTPVLYYATFFLNTGSGVMVTGSHNPPEYNGLKIMLGGDMLSGDAIQALHGRMQRSDFTDGAGQLQSMDLLADYIREVAEDMPVALGSAFKLVVDAGNGVAGDVAPKLLRALGHDVIELYCEVDGSFPNHHPDPSDPENLRDLRAAVAQHGADMGIAFDGDGDRVGIVDETGAVVWPDQLMMIFARDVLTRNPGASIVFDVKCSSRLRTLIEEAGGTPIMAQTGHSFMRSKLKETGAPLAGELSGHIFFEERWYGFDDGMYVAARLLEILMSRRLPASELFAEVPLGVATPELRLELAEGQHFAVMRELSQSSVADAEVFTIDGLRAEFADGWGLVRASNTTPSLVFRFEADDEAALERVQGVFRALVEQALPDTALPF